MLSVTRRFEFDFAHKLPNYEGKCADLHGHRGVLEVEISDEYKPGPNAYPGFIIDFGDLKSIIEKEIIDKFDHKYINDLIYIPTAENIVKKIKGILTKNFGDSLVRVRFYETPNSYAEWKK